MKLSSNKTIFNYSLEGDTLESDKGNLYLQKCIRILITKGCRSKAEAILIQVCIKLKQDYKNQLIAPLIYSSIENVKPFLEIRNVRVSGTTRQVPTIIKPKRQISLAIQWMVEAAKKRKKKSSLNFADCLYLEITDALKKRGSVKQKTEELHKVAVLNRAFAHYRWW